MRARVRAERRTKDEGEKESKEGKQEGRTEKAEGWRDEQGFKGTYTPSLSLFAQRIQRRQQKKT